jgi:hypothetical protein
VTRLNAAPSLAPTRRPRTSFERLEKLTSRAASAAAASVRAEDGLVVHRPMNGKGDGNAWQELDGTERLEKRFMVEYEKLLDDYLEGFEPEMDL